MNDRADLEAIALRGELSSVGIGGLADLLLQYQKRSPVRGHSEAVEAAQYKINQNMEMLDRDQKCSFNDLDQLKNCLLKSLIEVEPLLIRREHLRQIRYCRRSLRIRDFINTDDHRKLSIEDTKRAGIITADVLYELAFLVEDLLFINLRKEASVLFNRYLWASADEALQIEGLVALPLYLAMSALDRAKLTAEVERDLSGSVRQSSCPCKSASNFLNSCRPRIIAIGGLSGTGKSTLASALAPFIGRSPGAVHIRSDIERKRKFGVPEFERLPPNSYSPEVSATIHDEMVHLAGCAVSAGQGAVLDAVHRSPDQRLRLSALAEQYGALFTGIWLEAPVDILRARVDSRKSDASDATSAIVDAQAKMSIGDITWTRIDASGPPEFILRQALKLCPEVETVAR